MSCHCFVTDHSRTLLLSAGEEYELVEVDVLAAGSAVVVPAAKDGLEEADDRVEAQVGRRAFGRRRSRVRKACAKVTRAQW